MGDHRSHTECAGDRQGFEIVTCSVLGVACLKSKVEGTALDIPTGLAHLLRTAMASQLYDGIQGIVGG